MQNFIKDLKDAVQEDNKEVENLHNEFSKSIDLISKYIDERNKISKKMYSKEENIKQTKFLIDFIEKNHLTDKNLSNIDFSLMKFILKELFKLDKTSYDVGNDEIQNTIVDFLFENMYNFKRLLYEEENKELAGNE